MERLLTKLRDLAFTNITFKPLIESIKQNQELFESLKIDWNTSIKCGGLGCIFESRDPFWVIKLTTDSYEAKLFEIIRDENIKSGFVRVKDIYLLDNKTFIIVKQKIIPLDEMSTNYDYITTQYINFMHVYYQEMQDVTQGRKSLSAAIMTIRKHTFKDIVDIFISLRKLAYSGYRLMDIDPDNIGYADTDQLVIFDAQLESLK